MNKHFLALARAFGVKTFYYISPQVWASREGRVQKMRRLIDGMGVILPFEEPWLRERGVNATFVGHPLFDDLPADPDGYLEHLEMLRDEIDQRLWEAEELQLQGDGLCFEEADKSP